MVVDAIAQAVREALHVGDFVFDVMGILVAFAIAKAFHQAGGGVADVQRNGFGGGLFYILLDGCVGGIEGVGFGGGAEIDDGLRQGEIAFGHADEVDGVAAAMH